MKLTSILGAVAITVGGAVLSAAPAQAVMINGQLDIIGIVNVQSSIFAPGGTLDFDQASPANIVAFATDDFASFVSVGMTPTLFDLTFTGPVSVYSIGGFTFTANSFFDFDNASPGRGFAANGILSGNGFGATPGLLTLSTQSNSGSQIKASFSSTTTATPVPVPASVLMLLSALGGLGLFSRRRRTAA